MNIEHKVDAGGLFPMIVFLLLIAIIAAPTAVGFLRSRRQRSIDRRHRAAFVGFSAASVAITAMIAGIAILFWFGPVKSRYMSAEWDDTIAVVSVVEDLSTLMAFGCGFFTSGGWRLFLIAFGPVMLFVTLLIAFSNFGS